jgi:crossover junction endodeoxyribonuclease RuvC
MKVLGIDPGLCKTGWGLVEQKDEKPEYVACGVIKTDVKSVIGDRLCTINRQLTDIIKEHNPDYATIEEVFVNTNVASSQKLIMARAVAFLSVAQAGFEVFEYSPNEIKKAVTGRGHAGKDLVFFFVKKLLEIDITMDEFVTTDSIDALAVALCHISSVQWSLKLRTCL